MHACMHACMCVCACMCMCVHACACVCVCMHACMRACVHACVRACMCVCVYACAYPDCFQAFANVSTTLRDGFYLYKNKVTIGLVLCKIYDRFHVKRCNNCQKFGHYMNECSCHDHCTRDCTSNESVCINHTTPIASSVHLSENNKTYRRKRQLRFV